MYHRFQNDIHWLHPCIPVRLLSHFELHTYHLYRHFADGLINNHVHRHSYQNHLRYHLPHLQLHLPHHQRHPQHRLPDYLPL